MRSVYSEEMDLVWANYLKIMKKIPFKELMTTTITDLRARYFNLNYKNLYFQAKYRAEQQGKSKSEISYSILKLRRLIALWVKSDIWKIDGGVSYSDNDKNKEFPMFKLQRPSIYPMSKTIKRIQVRAITEYIDRFNNKCQENSSSKSAVKQIRNLRDLRIVLKAQEKLNDEQLNYVIGLYKSAIAKKDANDFSNDCIKD